MIFASRKRLHYSYHSVFNTSRTEIIRSYFGILYHSEYTHTIPVLPHPESYERRYLMMVNKFYRVCGMTYDIKDLK